MNDDDDEEIDDCKTCKCDKCYEEDRAKCLERALNKAYAKIEEAKGILWRVL